MLPPHSRGGGGSEAAAAAASMSKEAAVGDSSRCVGSGGRPRWLMIHRSMACLCSIVASARANLWSSDASVVSNEQTTSITAASSLDLT